MSLKQSFANPFYFLLLLAGLVFSVTACAYGVLIVRGLQAGAGAGAATLPNASHAGEQLMAWLDEHGFKLLLVELTALALFCILAVTTDSYWERRAAAKRARDEKQTIG